jgi:hypothetical protein
MEVDDVTIVGYPFTIRKDTLVTKTYEMGTLEAKRSELSLLVATEEGEVRHLSRYGVKKRDILLFTSDVDDSRLGVLLLRIQEKVAEWIEDIDVTDLEVVSRERNKLTLLVKFTYNENEDVAEVLL